MSGGRQRLPSTARGFTLIEAIVAVAIIGACVIPVMGFVSQTTLQLQRIGDANARSLAQEDVLNFLETLNPMAQPEGSLALGGLTVRWTSRILVPPNKNARIGTGLPAHTVGFYVLDLSVARGTGPEWFSFSARKIGYQRLVATDMLGVQP